jgi:putative glutamine amidotransferase
MARQPIVGICADRKVIGHHASHAVGEKYIAAVVGGADAFAVLLPVLDTPQSIERTLGLVDGLVFPGSYSNVEPHRYDGTPSLPGTLHDRHRDDTALPLIDAAIRAGVPVLAICRGFQEMNVVRGGSLHQQVHAVEGLHDHRENPNDPLDRQYAPSHPVQVVPGGILHGISGALQIQVNSLHGQGVDRLGNGLTVEATAADGLIEAFSVTDAPAFAFAVQWHPEWRYAQDTVSSAMFAAFGEACRKRSEVRPVSHG